LSTFEHWRGRVVGRFRDATIHGGETTLWVNRYQIALFATCPFVTQLPT
jgi:hypothetical protein